MTIRCCRCGPTAGNTDEHKALLTKHVEADSWRLRLVTYLAFFSNGVSSAFPSAACSYYAKDTLKATPEELAGLFATTSLALMLPFCMKPLYGFFMDSIPICNQKRRPYIVFGLLLAGALPFLQAFSTDVNEFFATLLLANVGSAIVLLGGESLVVDYIALNGLGTGSSSHLWGSSWIIQALTSVVAAGLGSYLVNVVQPSVVFVISGSLQLCIALAVILLGNVEPATTTSVSCSEGVCVWWRGTKNIVQEKVVLLVVLVGFVVYLAPQIGQNDTGTAFYYYSDGLHLDKQVLTSTTLWLNNLSWAVGYYLYMTFLSEMEISRCVLVLLAVSAALQLSSVPLFGGITEGEVTLSVVYVLLWNVPYAIVCGMWCIPFYTLAERVCVPGSESTVFAIVTAMQNLGILLGTQICVALMHTYGITNHHFPSLGTVVLICGVLQMVVVPLVWLLPKDLALVSKQLKASSNAHTGH